ncbi:hypothetical protein LINPERHAP2_LOCUS22706 [Linum perenne]
MLLSAIGKDDKNHMYLIALAVVESENRHSWTWFIDIIREQLDMSDGTGWSLISDQHKVDVLYFTCVCLIWIDW